MRKLYKLDKSQCWVLVEDGKKYNAWTFKELEGWDYNKLVILAKIASVEDIPSGKSGSLSIPGRCVSGQYETSVYWRSDKEPTKSNAEHECICPLNELLIHGCKCGGK